MIKSHQTKVAGGDKKHFAEYKHVTQKLKSPPRIRSYTFFPSLVAFFFVVTVVMTILFD